MEMTGIGADNALIMVDCCDDVIIGKCTKGCHGIDLFKS